MPRRDQVKRKLAIEGVAAGLGGDSLYRVTSSLYRHTHSTTATACPCCGNPFAKLDEVVPDLDLLVDLDKRWRGCRHQVDNTREWDRQAEQADRVFELPIRVSEVSEPLVLDTFHQVILASGGSRSSKTQTGSYWSLRQWMMRGGWGTIAAFLGFEVEQAHILKDKFCIGEGTENPPVCDPGLVVSFPPMLRSADQNIHMIDGTRIRLTHTKSDGGNISGRGFIFVQWTEAAKTKHQNNYAQVRGRVVSTRGQIYMDAVPEANHWLKSTVVEPAEEEAELRADAVEAGNIPEPTTIRCETLAAEDNPWNDPEQAKALHRDLLRLDPRVAARYGKGEWVGDANKTFGEYFDAVKHTFELEAWTLDHLGMADVTRAASLRWFYDEHDWLVGLDVNANPHSAAIAKIGVPMELLGPVRHGSLTHKQRKVATNPANWVLTVFDFLQVWGKDSEQAAKILAKIHGGKFAGAGVVMDGMSCYDKHNAGGHLNSKRNIQPRLAYEDQGFEVEPPAKTTKSRTAKGGQPMNPSRYDSAIVVRRLLRHDQFMAHKMRCRPLIKAIRDQDSEPDGITPVRASNTADDRHIIGPTDVVRYLSWPFFRLDEMERPGGDAATG